MPKRPYTPDLSDDLITTICNWIKAGAYPHIAAEREGVPRNVFADWLRKAEKKHCPLLNKKLAHEVMKAKAYARLFAEINMRKDDSKNWLLSGPGKENADNPGWSKPTNPAEQPQDTTTDTLNILMHPEFSVLMSALLQALAPHEEAKAAVLDALTGQKAAETHPFGTNRS